MPTNPTSKGNKAPKITAGPIAVEQSFIAAKGSTIPPQSTWTLDQGVDIPFMGHVKMLAVGPGEITAEGISGFGDWAPVLKVTSGPLSGKTFYYGHCGPNFKHVGDKVQAGEAITQIADPTVGISTGPHIEFGQSDTAGTPLGEQTSSETQSILIKLQENALVTPTVGGGVSQGPSGPAEVGSVSAAEVAAISKGSALAAYLNLPTFEKSFESLALEGNRSLMNDLPLMSFVEQMCQASLRSFMSMPDGSFFAWLPDYFGGLTERTAYWSIDDIEILSGTMELSDDALATHVYVVGDTATIDQQVEWFEKVQSTGVVTVFNAFQADFITGFGSTNKKSAKEAPILTEKSAAINFLEKYGARPYYQEAPMIRSHYFEMFLAYQMFCLLWSQQFTTKFEFTFMPELFPGGIVEFPQHGIQCYIEEVRHEGSYEDGFRTIANLTAPSALSNSPEGVHDGMVRADVFNPQTISEYAHNTGGNSGQGEERK